MCKWVHDTIPGAHNPAQPGPIPTTRGILLSNLVGHLLPQRQQTALRHVPRATMAGSAASPF